MYKYTAKQVSRLLDRAMEKNLFAQDSFWSADIEELRKYYNGIGPDSWSDSFRGWVTAALSSFEEEALIHDYDYGTLPRTYWEFTKSNVRFAANSVLSAYKSLEDVKAIILQSGLGIALALVCQLFGWHGFKTTKVEVSE